MMVAQSANMQSLSLLLLVCIPLVGAIAILWLHKNQNYREAVSIVSSVAAFITVLNFVPDVLSGYYHQYELFVLIPGIRIAFYLDGLGIVFALVASFLWILATYYNVGYMRSLNEKFQTRYYFCFAIAVFGALGVALSSNIFTMYLFYEVISIFTYPLVAHHQDKEAFSGARKYMVYLMGTSKLFFLPALALTYVLAGTLDFNLADIKNGIFSKQVIIENPLLVQITYWLYIAGLAKAALMPLHNWLPSAMVAPTPVSALLHAVAVVKAGVFSVSRIILSVFGVNAMEFLNLGLPTAYIAGFTIVVASIIAITKDDIKAMLAYSTIGQLSYIIIGVALLNYSSIEGGLMHIAHHAFAKITLFFAAGAIYVACGLKSIKQMNGLARKMPLTFGAFALASLSMIGIPPVSGFVSKWYLLNGAVQAGQSILMFALLLSTILNAAYFVPVIYRAFFLKPESETIAPTYDEAPLSMVMPLVLTAIISVALGLCPQVFSVFIKNFIGV